MIDFLCSKTFYVKESSNSFVRVACMKLVITQNSYITVSSIISLTNSLKSSYALVLIRNDDKLLKKIFKNKIKLKFITFYNEEDVYKEGYKLAEFLNIRFIKPPKVNPF